TNRSPTSHTPLTVKLQLQVFTLIQRRSLTSTLFPYTTLFRSGFSACRRPRHNAVGSSDPSGFVIVTHPFHPLNGQRLEVLYAKRDRKSTRLNSSHVKISYAVFCLKKKSRGVPSGSVVRHPAWR